MIFSTRDRDNDMWNTGGYSNELTGGWWFNDCRNSNLNGQFKGNTKAYSGIGWIRFKHNLSLKFVEMKMRVQFFLKEKEDEREKGDKFYFSRIRETVLSAYLNYFLQKLVIRTVSSTNIRAKPLCLALTNFFFYLSVSTWAVIGQFSRLYIIVRPTELKGLWLKPP